MSRSYGALRAFKRVSYKRFAPTGGWVLIRKFDAEHYWRHARHYRDTRMRLRVSVAAPRDHLSLITDLRSPEISLRRKFLRSRCRRGTGPR